MNRTLIQTGAVVTMDPARRVILRGAILVDGNRIEAVVTPEELGRLGPLSADVVDAAGQVAIPGFVQTHIHLCQTLFRGLADELELLDWLALRIFPFEAAHSPASMYASALLGAAELIRSGTTTLMDMGSVDHEEEIVRVIETSGLRACLGKAMMDINDGYPLLKESTHSALTSTLDQARQWHRFAGDRIRYAVAPRFILSCSDELLREAYAMTADFPGMMFHTHAAENRHEMDAVRTRCGVGNVQYFENIGVLRSNTCLAHCIWVDEREMELMAQREVRVLHCPTSNLKLGSGIARIPEMLRRGIAVSLGADGAPCNNTLDMFEEMRLAALIQKPVHGPSSMDARTVFELATLSGAGVLGMTGDIGSIEPGKKADIVLLDLAGVWNPLQMPDVYSAIVYTGSPENVRSVMVDGQWLFRNGHQMTLDEERAVAVGREELTELLKRVRNS